MKCNIIKIAAFGMLFFGLLFGSCKDDNFTIGGYLTDPHTRITKTDTLTVKVFNLAVDSVISSATGVVFSGYYNDPQIGKLTAQSFIEFDRPSGVMDVNAEFDSITLKLKPNGNYYGDTISLVSLKVFRLVEPIEMGNNGYLYSTSTVPIGEELVDTAVKVKVWENRDFEITLPRSLGEMLFKGVKDDETYLDADHYLKTFPGLSITAGTGSRCVNAFAADTSCRIKIYYHINTSYRENTSMSFTANSAKQFYHLSNNKLPLLNYNSESDPVPSRDTENKGILMTGTPMYAQLEFPYLNNFLETNEIVKISSAMLRISPIRNSFDTIPLPGALNLSYYDPTKNTQVEVLTVGPGKNYPDYVFNVTDFISGQLGQIGYNKYTMNVSIPEDVVTTTIQRLVFGDQEYWYNGGSSRDYQVKLEVTYVTYNQ